MDTALVRQVPDSFVEALRGEPGPALDPYLARKQHGEYVAALAAAGYAVAEIEADEEHPDCVFVEDTAVIIGPIAVLARSGAVSRRGEVGPVREVLSGRFSIETVEAPGTMDGGDVMLVGDTLFVGRSERTNSEAIAQLETIAAPLGVQISVVEVRDALHLKSVVLPLDEESVLVTPGSVDEAALGGLRTIHEVEAERHRCSALPLRDGRLLVTEGAPKTMELLGKAGYTVAPIDVSELQAADGGLTCLSILLAGSLPIAAGQRQDEGS